MKKQVNLSDEFFELLRKYSKLQLKTGDKNFDEYVGNFYAKNLPQYIEEIGEEIKNLKLKIFLLENFTTSLYKYEMSVSEINWAYQSFEERERNLAIYRFLCKYTNIYARSNCIRKMKKQKLKKECELKAIKSLDEFPERKELLERYKIADKYYERLEREFRKFLTENPRNKLTKKYGQNLKCFDRAFFDSHIKEINDLQDGMQITFDF